MYWPFKHQETGILHYQLLHLLYQEEKYLKESKNNGKVCPQCLKLQQQPIQSGSWKADRKLRNFIV